MRLSAVERSTETLIFADIETAGLDPLRHPITEIAAVAVCAKSFRELEALSVRVRFDASEADPKALGINKYDQLAWTRTAIPPRDVAHMFATFCRRHATLDRFSARTGKPYQLARLVAHNGELFDGPFLHSWYARLGVYLPAAKQVLCTKQRAMWLFEEDRTLTPPDNYKLETLCEYFGTSKPDHTAFQDIRSTVELYRAIMERTRGLRNAA